MTYIEALQKDVMALCEERAWSMHWTARGAYLHLEASELIEAWRGKGDSTVAAEAGDVLVVLLSIIGAAGVPWPDVVAGAARKVDRMRADRTLARHGDG